MIQAQSKSGILFALFLVFFHLLGAPVPLSAQGATFEVTNALDGPEPGPEGSLRWAISQANMSEGNDTIEFTGAFQIALESQIGITESVTIVGFRAAGDNPLPRITIADNIVSRVFAFDSDDPGRLDDGLVLKDLIIFGGRTMQDATDLNACDESTGQGGAVCAQGDLTIEDTIIGSSSTSGQGAVGGGIFVRGQLTLLNSNVQFNSTSGADAPGGGVYVAAFDTTGHVCAFSGIFGNSTNGDRSPGGGIFLDGPVTGRSCDVGLNETWGDESHGGGIYADFIFSESQRAGWLIRENSVNGFTSSGAGALVRDAWLWNTTVSGNVANGSDSVGSGIVLVSDERTGTRSVGSVQLETTVQSSTIYDNFGGSFSNPGALVLDNGALLGETEIGFDIRLGNSILARNRGNFALPAFIPSLAVNESPQAPIGVELVSVFPQDPFTDAETDPELGPFLRAQLCGKPIGPRFGDFSTCPGGHIPGELSPVIDAGSIGGDLTLYARDGRGPGYDRIVDGSFMGGEARIDIGAIEFSPFIEVLYFPQALAAFFGFENLEEGVDFEYGVAEQNPVLINWIAEEGADCIKAGAPGTGWAGVESGSGFPVTDFLATRALDVVAETYPAELELSLTCAVDGFSQTRIRILRLLAGIAIDEFEISAGQVLAGEIVDISWDAFPSVDATQCSGTGLDGTAWSGFSGGGAGSLSIDTTGLLPGVYELELECTLPDGSDEEVRASDVIELEVIPPPLQIAQFEVAPATVEQGEPLVIEWDVLPEQGPDCEAGGLPGSSWDGQVPLQGLQTVETGSLAPGQYEVSLACTFGGDSANEGRIVEVQLPPADLSIQAQSIGALIPGRQLVTLQVENFGDQEAVGLTLDAVVSGGADFVAAYRLAPSCAIGGTGGGQVSCDLDLIPDWQCVTGDGLSCSLARLPGNSRAAVVVELQGNVSAIVTGSVSAINAAETSTQVSVGN